MRSRLRHNDYLEGRWLLLVILAALAAITLQASPSWHDAPSVDGLAGAEVRAVEVTSDGSVWLGVHDRGLARIKGDKVDWIGTADGLVADGVASLLEDSAGRLWAAGVGGFSILEGGRWVPYRTIGTLQPRVVFGIYEEARTGSVWLAAKWGRGTPNRGCVAGAHTV